MRLCAMCVALAGTAAACRADTKLFVLTDFLFPQLAEIDISTGGMLSAVPVSGHEALFGGLAVDDAGTFWSIDGYNDSNPDRTFSISPSGSGAVVGPTGENWNFRTVCVHRGTNALFAATDNRLYTINTTTGAATAVGNILAGPQLDQMTALAINAQGQAFITDIQDTSLFSLDLVTGQATFIAHVGQTGNWFEDLAFDDQGVLWGVRQQGGVYTIDTATGAETFRFGGSYKGLVFVSDGCYPDCNTSGSLTIADFSCFQNAFVANDPYADCNASGGLTIADFSCFQNAFVAGCP